MEIHAPHKPIESAGEFFFHHHEPAENARANILNELRDNHGSLDAHLKEAGRLKAERRHTFDVLNLFIARKRRVGTPRNPPALRLIRTTAM